MVQQSFEGFDQPLLVAFDGQQILPAALVEDLLRRLRLRVQGVGQHPFAGHVQPGQEGARGRDFIALLGHDHGAQPVPTRRD